jgi:serine/threonine protein kinase
MNMRAHFDENSVSIERKFERMFIYHADKLASPRNSKYVGNLPQTARLKENTYQNELLPCSNLLKTKIHKIGPYKVLKMLGKSKFSIYIVRSVAENKRIVLKVFNYQEKNISNAFQNEKRFVVFRHPNIINFLGEKSLAEEHPRVNQVNLVSYIALEYAPYGDLADFLLKHQNHFSQDPILVRTIFHKIVSGVFYLHSKGAAHLDLKLENVLIGENYKILITDFDSSAFKGDADRLGRGTKNYRAPEVKNICGLIDNQAADIYSLGIMLFTLTTTSLPFIEDELVDGVDLQTLALKNDSSFWGLHAEISGGVWIEDQDFQQLFWSMIQSDHNKRPTISKIKQSNYYIGPIYSDDEFENMMRKLNGECLFDLVKDNQKKGDSILIRNITERI